MAPDSGKIATVQKFEEQIQTTARRCLKHLDFVCHEIAILHLALDHPCLQEKGTILDGGGEVLN